MPDKLDNLVKDSTAIITAEVVSRYHGITTSTRAIDERVPYTDVTFKVTDVLLGKVGKEITLRFQGGIDENTKRIITASFNTNFDVGEKAILFLLSDEETAHTVSPLVGGHHGRLRDVYSKRDREWFVFSDLGNPVLLDRDGSLRFGGTTWELDEIIENTIGNEKFYKVTVNPDSFGSYELSNTSLMASLGLIKPKIYQSNTGLPQKQPKEIPLSYSKFRFALKAIIDKTFTPYEQSQLPPVLGVKPGSSTPVYLPETKPYSMLSHRGRRP
ncbi:MAG: hypothetical protein D6808_06115 [Candidatus Dadabacteria bacterium]|nr:MAG: hypothetical protein D6808_06115 [Candidatus Dadabacteria bacterium]